MAKVNRVIAKRSLKAFDLAAAQEPQPISQAIESQAQDDVPEELEEPISGGGKKAINTTPEELALFDKIKAIYAESLFSSNRDVFDPAMRKHVPVEIGYKDTTAYFGIYINKPGWWFMRANIETAYHKWVGFNMPSDKIRHLVPSDIALMLPSAFAETRIAISGIDDIEKLKPVILAAIDHEIMKHQYKDEVEPPQENLE